MLLVEAQALNKYLLSVMKYIYKTKSLKSRYTNNSKVNDKKDASSLLF